MRQVLILDYKFPSLNDYIKAERTHRILASAMKKEFTETVMIEAQIQKIKKVGEKPVTIDFEWIEPNAKRDLDNISYAKKFILDGLVSRGILVNDTRKYVTGFTDTFPIGIKHCVIVTIKDE